MQYLYYLIGLLGSGLVYFFMKAQSSAAIAQNTNVKEQLLNKDAQEAKNNDLIDLEAQMRQMAENAEQQKKDSGIDPKDF
jgi:hypothetical protein